MWDIDTVNFNYYFLLVIITIHVSTSYTTYGDDARCHLDPTYHIFLFLFSFFAIDCDYFLFCTSLSYLGGSQLQSFFGYDGSLCQLQGGRAHAQLCLPWILRIFLCGFPCLLSLCTLVTSGSPQELILLLSLLIYDSKNARLLHMLLCATPIFS